MVKHDINTIPLPTLKFLSIIYTQSKYTNFYSKGQLLWLTIISKKKYYTDYIFNEIIYLISIYLFNLSLLLLLYFSFSVILPQELILINL